jgi:hypothetical protein
MTDYPRQLMTPPGPDEKTTPVMFYTATAIYWGDLIAKQPIRISTWLQYTEVPDTLCIKNAKILMTTAPVNPPKPIVVPELNLNTGTILAYHLLPPTKDQPDYDASEPNRSMDPISVIVGTFRMDGLIRMSNRSTLRRHLELSHNSFTSIYDVDISNLVISALGVVRVSMVQIRQSGVQFAVR